MGRGTVGRRISRSKQFRLIALLNTIYIYKSMMYTCVFIWAIASFSSGLHYKAWDYGHLGKASYCLLHFSLLASPVLSLIALKTRHQIISLYLSVAADSSIAFGIFAYSMVLLEEFGMTIASPILWGMFLGLLSYALSDAMLIRLINSQPDIASEEYLALVRTEIDRARLKEFVGLRKWQGLVEAAGGAEILENIIKQQQNTE